MGQLTDLNELNHALISNFRLKAKSLAILFGVVFCFQISLIIYFYTQTDYIGKVIPLTIAIVGPIVLLSAILCEVLAIRHLKKMDDGDGQLKKSFIYLVTFIEVSFPIGIMLMIGGSLSESTLMTPFQMVNSPLFVMVFVMITLSSLLLDFRLCVFAGIVAGIEYAAVNFHFFSNMEVNRVDCVNAVAKSVLVVVTGLLSGFVSKKIREAVISSLHSKNELIHNLDKRVAEKTAEVVAQKNEIEKKNEQLEVKQKEILDSIHYARRIQHTQLPTHTYIAKNLSRLRKKK